MRLTSAGATVVAVLIVIVMLNQTHAMAALAVEVDLEEVSCEVGEVDSVTVSLTHTGDQPVTIIAHTWDQRRHVRYAWNFSTGRALRLKPGTERVATITATSEQARISSGANAQVMFNDGQRRTYLHFESPTCNRIG